MREIVKVNSTFLSCILKYDMILYTKILKRTMTERVVYIKYSERTVLVEAVLQDIYEDHS